MTKLAQNSSFILAISSVAALGGLLFGFDTAVISGAIPSLQALFSLDEYALGWAVSSILIGRALGALVAGKLADRFGRRFTLMACAMFFAIVFGILLAYFTNYAFANLADGWRWRIDG